MTSQDPQKDHQHQTQAGQPAPSHERNKGHATHAHPTTQAERAVMHPAMSTGPDDYFDPDWRCYYAAVA